MNKSRRRRIPNNFAILGLLYTETTEINLMHRLIAYPSRDSTPTAILRLLLCIVTKCLKAVREGSFPRQRTQAFAM
jgi:hypothetical protein